MKTIISTLVLATTICAAAQVRELTKDSTEADFRAVAAEALAFTNPVECANFLDKSNFYNMLVAHKELSALREELDATLAAKKIGHSFFSYANYYPASTRQFMDDHTVQSGSPHLYSVFLKYKGLRFSFLINSGITMDECVGLLTDACNTFSGEGYRRRDVLDSHKALLQLVAQKGIRKALRRQGKSFVSKNGINPCEQYLNALTTALNAPRFEGLNAWLESLGYQSRLDTSKLPAEAEINSLKEKILDGDISPNTADLYLLYICLGVDGYNSFVKEYNGD